MVYVPNTKRVWMFGGWNGVDQLLDVWTLDECACSIVGACVRKHKNVCFFFPKSLHLFLHVQLFIFHTPYARVAAAWEWSQPIGVKGEAPPALRGHTMCASGDHIFVFGGLHGLSRYTNDLHVLDTKTLEWFRVPDGGNGEVPPPRAWHSAVMIGKSMVVVGGTAGRALFHDDVYLLDTGVCFESVLVFVVYCLLMRHSCVFLCFFVWPHRVADLVQVAGGRRRRARATCLALVRRRRYACNGDDALTLFRALAS